MALEQDIPTEATELLESFTAVPIDRERRMLAVLGFAGLVIEQVVRDAAISEAARARGFLEDITRGRGAHLARIAKVMLNDYIDQDPAGRQILRRTIFFHDETDGLHEALYHRAFEQAITRG